MKREIAIYLAGSIKKDQADSAGFYWTDADMRCLEKSLPECKLSFLNPAFRTDDLSDQFSVFGRDMTQVFCSDLVFVDARGRRGLGVGAEMMWAKFHKIPVLAWAPKDTHYHKTSTRILGVPTANWVHPFIESLCDAVVENLEEGASWIQRFTVGDAPEIKGVDSIASAMRYYRDTKLAQDEPMKAIVADNQRVCQKVSEGYAVRI